MNYKVLKPVKFTKINKTKDTTTADHFLTPARGKSPQTRNSIGRYSSKKR